jgi:hypothetical protein
VDAPHRGHDTDLRAGDRGQVGDLAAHVHAHLKDRRLVLRAEAHHCQRQADLVVGVALALERGEALAEHGRDRLLGRGLGDAAGHAHDERRESAPPGSCHGVQTLERVRYDHGRGPAAGQGLVLGGKLAHEQSRGACVQGQAQEAVAVRALARQGHEQVARPYQPRIDGSPEHGPVRGDSQAATGDGGDLGGGQGERPAGPSLRLAGVGHLKSVAQPTSAGGDAPDHPCGVAFLPPGGAGPSGFGGM